MKMLHKIISDERAGINQDLLLANIVCIYSGIEKAKVASDFFGDFMHDWGKILSMNIRKSILLSTLGIISSLCSGANFQLSMAPLERSAQRKRGAIAHNEDPNYLGFTAALYAKVCSMSSLVSLSLLMQSQGLRFSDLVRDRNDLEAESADYISTCDRAFGLNGVELLPESVRHLFLQGLCEGDIRKCNFSATSLRHHVTFQCSKQLKASQGQRLG